MPHENIRRRCLVLVVGVILFGCAGFKDVSYFKPLPHEQVRVSAGMRGLPEIVKIPLSESVELTLIVFDEAQHSLLRMIFHLPAGELARFENENVTVTPLGGGQTVLGTIETIQAIYVTGGRGSIKNLVARDDLMGATYEYDKAFAGKAKMPRQFEIDVAFSTRLPDHFKLRIPKLNLSGKVASIPELEFKRQNASAYQGSAP